MLVLANMSRAAVCLLFVPLFCSGCFTLIGLSAGFTTDYDHREVLLLDGDTGQPIPNATVWTPKGEWGAWGDEARTDRNGRARLRVARYVGRGFYADAPGYLPGSSYTGIVTPNHTDITLELYRPPAPMTGISVPVGFRGSFRVDTANTYGRWHDWSPGQREFYTPINVNGVTKVLASPIPQGRPWYVASVQLAKFDDGTPVRFENPIGRSGWSGEFVHAYPDLRDRVPPRCDGVALYDLGLRTEGGTPPLTGYEIFYVGTLQDAAEKQEELIRSATPTVPAGAPKAGEYYFRPNPLTIDGLPTGQHG